MINLSEKKGGGLIYNPPMMQFDGSTGYYNLTANPDVSSGFTVIGQFIWEGGTITSAGGFNRILVALVDETGWVKAQVAIVNDQSGDSRAGCLSAFVQDNAGGTLLNIVGSTIVSDGGLYSFLIAYDPSGGTAVLKINSNVDETNSSATGYTITTGTPASGSGANSFGARAIPDRYFDGKMGFLALKNSYDVNWSAYFDQFGNPKPTDFSGWLFGHFAGKMDENEGTAGAMTKNGTITLVDPGQAPHIGLPTIGTAEAWDLKTGKIAWVDGVEKVGTGYFPAMMQFDGSTGYYSDTSYTSSGSAVTCVVRFAVSSHTGGGSEFIAVAQGPTSIGRVVIMYGTSDHGTANFQDRIRVEVRNSSNVIICLLMAPFQDYIDGEPHTLFFAFDGGAGTAIFRIDGVDADDTGNGSRTAPTTGTLSSGAGSDFGVGATDTGTGPFNGSVGFCGMRDAYLTNWSDFMQTDGTPKQLDESTWTEWGAQPLFWNEHGDMVNNLGSAGAMTKNGTINVTEGGGGVAGMTANTWDIKTGKTAYLTGGSATGTGYFPAMMEFDGSTGYYSKAFTRSGSKITFTGSFIRSPFTNASERIARVITTGAGQSFVSIFESNHATATRQNKMSFYVTNSSNVAVCHLLSDVVVADGKPHTFFAEFDGVAGTGKLIIDGVDADDLSNPDRIAPVTATLGTTTPTFYVGSFDGASGFFGGKLGFLGHGDVSGLDPTDFMQTDGAPKQLDESTWTEWTAQPKFWHESGKMDENLGSAGAMTKNGSIILAPASSWS